MPASLNCTLFIVSILLLTVIRALSAVIKFVVLSNVAFMYHW